VTRSTFVFPPFTSRQRVRAERLMKNVRRGRPVPDAIFDQIYPRVVMVVSSVHWTPVRVCLRATQLLRLERGVRVLDIGAGVGKFAIITASASGASVRGVERERALADVAREAAERLGADVELVCGTFEAEDPKSFDAVYLFNPFIDAPLLPGLARDLPEDRFGARAAADVLAAEKFLRAMRPGSRLVTYCGFGGIVPRSFERRASERWAGGALDLWEKLSSEPPVGHGAG
jgi:SAM-dependent methyltransferase